MKIKKRIQEEMMTVPAAWMRLSSSTSGRWGAASCATPSSPAWPWCRRWAWAVQGLTLQHKKTRDNLLGGRTWGIGEAKERR